MVRNDAKLTFTRYRRYSNNTSHYALRPASSTTDSRSGIPLSTKFARHQTPWFARTPSTTTDTTHYRFNMRHMSIIINRIEFGRHGRKFKFLSPPPHNKVCRKPTIHFIRMLAHYAVGAPQATTSSQCEKLSANVRHKQASDTTLF